jgi:hypothetical protein
MASESQAMAQPDGPAEPGSVVVPRPTAAPVVLAVGLTLLAAGVPFGPGFLAAGAALVIAGLGLWIGQLLPGQGHVRESVGGPLPRAVTPSPGGVERLREGMPGYRLRLPQAVHPVSAGITGGLAGAALMPVPAVLWGLLSGHGPLYPVNLLAGMVLPTPAGMGAAELEQYLRDFHWSLLLVAILIHVIMSVVFGLVYGVLLPTLPSFPRPIVWGGVVLPLLWTGTCYGLMGVVNPLLQDRVAWPWFVVSQLVFGLVAAAVVLRSEKVPVPPAGHGPERTVGEEGGGS